MKKNKNAFTLLELLAVIVVLAIVALITIPNISNQVDYSKNESFKRTAESLARSYEYKELETNAKLGRQDACSFQDGACKYPGYIDRDSSGKVLVYISSGSVCASGTVDDIKVTNSICGIDDDTAPIINNVEFINLTTESVDVIVKIEENESMIKSSKFRLLDKNGRVVLGWQDADYTYESDNFKISKKSYKNLTLGTDYYVELEIINTSNQNNKVTALYTDSKAYKFTTIDFNMPVIAYDKSKWETSKNITITYPTLDGIERKYRILSNNRFDTTGLLSANQVQSLVIDKYQYYVQAKATRGGSILTNTSQIGFVDNEADVNNVKPTGVALDYKNTNRVNTNEVSLNLKDTLSGVAYYCVSTTNSYSNCAGDGNNTELNKWVLAVNQADIAVAGKEVRNTTVQHQILDAGTYYIFVRDAVGNISNSSSFTVYRIDYDLNGGEGSINHQIKLKDNTLILTDEVPVREGYVFLGWDANKDKHSDTPTYLKQGEYKNNSNIKLYAQWRKEIVITYNANSGEGSVENSVCYKYNAEATCPIKFRTNSFARQGYTFKAWALGNNGETTYNVNTTYNIAESVTVYAGWKVNNLVFNNQSFTKIFDSEAQTINMVLASNGNGNYTYSEVSEKKNNVDTDYITVRENGVITISGSIPVGTYKYKIKVTSNVSNNVDSLTSIDLDAEMTITVNPYNISLTSDTNSVGLVITSVSDQIYINADITPEPIVKVKTSDNAKFVTLVKGTDFDYSYENNKNVGIGTIKVTGKGNYTNQNSITFNIVKYDLSNVTIDNISDLIYNGGEQKPEPVITASEINQVLTKGTDFDYSYENNKNVGTATVIITGKGNFKGTNSKNFVIKSKEVSVVWTNTLLTYNNANQAPTASISTGVRNEEISLSLTGEQKNVGEYTADVVCASVTTNNRCANYVLSNTSTNYSIIPYDISNVSIDTVSDKVYTGTPYTPEPSVTAPSISQTLEKGIDFEYSYENNTNSSAVDGDGIITVTGKGNFTGSKTRTFKINPAAGNKTFNCAVLTYNAAVQGLISTTGTSISNGEVYYSMTTPLNSTNYTTGTRFKIIDEPKATNAGTYTIYWYGKTDNYQGFSETTQCTIGQKGLTITASNQTVTYGTAINQGVGYITQSGLISGQSITGITLTQSRTDAGTGTITPSNAVVSDNLTNNYSISYNNGTLTINPQVLTVPGIPSDKTYSGSNQDSGISCPAGSNTSGNTREKNVGDYAQTCTLSSTKNYKWNDNTTSAKTINWKIVRATGSTTGNCYTLTYNGSNQTLAGGGNYVSYSSNTGNNAGSYNVTATADSNHKFSDGTLSKTFSCSISPKPLDIPSSPAAKTYSGGAQNSEVNCPGGSSASRDTSATYVGTYYHRCSLNNGNYVWNNGSTSVQDISWTISARSITFGAKNQTINYGSSIATGTGQVSIVSGSLGSGDGLSSISLWPNISDAGTGAIVPYDAVIAKNGTNVSGNYTIGYSNGILTINKVDASCPTISNYSGAYDGQPHTIGVSGGAGGTVQYNWQGWYTNDLPYQTNAGTTPVSVQIAGDANHNTKSCGSASISISKVNSSLSLSATSGTIDVGSSASATISGSNYGSLSCSSNNGSVAGCSISGTTLYITGVGIGSATITVSGSGGTNYNGSSVQYSATVRQACNIHYEYWTTAQSGVITYSANQKPASTFLNPGDMGITRGTPFVRTSVGQDCKAYAHETCLYEDASHIFCLSVPYWNVSASRTADKLKNEMTQAFIHSNVSSGYGQWGVIAYYSGYTGPNCWVNDGGTMAHCSDSDTNTTRYYDITTDGSVSAH